MPRLANSLLRRARKINPLLLLLLRPCRDLQSAKNELRWLREYAVENTSSLTDRGREIPLKLSRYCRQRARGIPLQYILKSQPFGGLDIRLETESYTCTFAERLLRDPNKQDSTPSKRSLRILDLCTGTGCIPLLLHSLLSDQIQDIKILGIDLSSTAVSLAKENLHYNIQNHCLKPSAIEQVHFKHGDVLQQKFVGGGTSGTPYIEEVIASTHPWDILISNPPYISRHHFATRTSRSVRNWEPRLALVPPDTLGFPGSNEIDRSGDVFYPRLLGLCETAEVKTALFEVGDMDQAMRVAEMAIKSHAWCPSEIEIWRDWVSTPWLNNCPEHVFIEGHSVAVRGEGHGRAVVLRKGGWSD
ncbi:MAG: hypothetical protein M1834_003855 [Cirrosporium novae-zelandiae]|nr:MAG: hypothetical protein M1834_003855 [Cirrosporium novae-zelandiae]